MARLWVEFRNVPRFSVLVCWNVTTKTGCSLPWMLNKKVVSFTSKDGMIPLADSLVHRTTFWGPNRAVVILGLSTVVSIDQYLVRWSVECWQ